MVPQLISQGKWTELATCLETWLVRATDVELMRQLAVACTRQKRHVEALSLLNRARDLAPESALIETNRGSVLRQLGDVSAAEACFRRAAALDSKLAAPCFNLGKMLAAQAYLSLAREPLREAVLRDPAHVEAWIKLGEVEKALGDIDAAVSAFRTAIRLRRTAGAAWWGLANLKTVMFNRDELKQLDRLWADHRLPIAERVLIGYARSHAHAALGSTESTWQALMDANRLKRRTVAWSAEDHSRHVDTLIEAWQTIDVPGEREQGQECLFIVGLPRSGSTLIEQVLSAHSKIAGASELPDLECVLRESQFAETAASAGAWARARQELMLSLGREYICRTQRWRTTAAISIDKTPANFLHIGAILRMLPGARIIDCRRDARDTAVSCLMQHFAAFAPWSNDLAEIRAYYVDYRRLMDHWHWIAPGRVIHVQYEDFVAQPVEQTARLLAALGLEFEASCSAPHKVRREVRTASAAQVVEPMDQRGLGRWTRYADHFEGWSAAG